MVLERILSDPQWPAAEHSGSENNEATKPDTEMPVNCSQIASDHQSTRRTEDQPLVKGKKAGVCRNPGDYVKRAEFYHGLLAQKETVGNERK